MKRSTPFAAAIAFAQALAAIASLPLGEQHLARVNLGTYKGRGKGRGVYSGKKPGNACTNWLAKLNGQTNGSRECARRLRQIERGSLAVSA